MLSYGNTKHTVNNKRNATLFGDVVYKDGNIEMDSL